MKMILPFKLLPFRVTSPYRSIRTNSGLHHGIDLVCDESPVIYAPCDGLVVRSRIITDKRNRTWEWGNYMTIFDGKHHIIYAHLAKRYMEAGERCKAGQPIGMMGATGNAQGAHLHLEVREYNTQTPINPAVFFGIPNAIGTFDPTTDINFRAAVLDQLQLPAVFVDYLDKCPNPDELYKAVYYGMAQK